MKSSAILIIALICSSTFASTTFLGTHSKLNNILSKIDSTDFGKNLLDTIALQLESNAPMDDIATLLRDMITDIKRQQEEADEAKAAKDIECDTEITEYNNRIEHANNEIQEATAAIKTLRNRKRDLEKAIKTREVELVLLDQHEQQIREDRTRDHAEYFVRTEQTEEVLEALEVIIPKLKAITPHNAAQVFAELAKIGNTNPIAALVQVASALDAEALTKCITLLEDLQVSFAAFMVEDQEKEISSQVLFDTMIHEIKIMREDTTAALDQDKIELVEVNGSLESQIRRREENTEELASAEAGLAAKTAECELYTSNYNRDSAQR